jgi:hypothetical protein
METAVELDDQVHLIASLIAPVPQGGGRETLPVKGCPPFWNQSYAVVFRKMLLTIVRSFAFPFPTSL